MELVKLEMGIRGMTCSGCAGSVERALASVPGVERAEVDYPAARATVSATGGVTADALLRAVEAAGYRADAVKPDGVRPRAGGREPEAGATPRERGPEAATGDGGGRDRDAGGFDCDLVVVGTGGAGMAAAIRASELGRTAVIVEGGDVVGGTCVNVGCIPSKNLIEAAHHYHAARSGFPGIAPCEPALDWQGVLRQKEELVGELRRQKYLDVLDAYAGVTLVRGRAELLGGGRVRVGERVIRGRRIVLATGTRPAMPPIPGLEDAGALDSTTVMEVERLPESMLVVGGGAIGLELGQAMSRFGVRVAVLEAMERILPGDDREVSALVQEALEAEGIEIHAGVRVTRVDRDGAGVTVSVERAGETETFRASELLVSTGRRPNTEGLGLEAAGVRTDPRGFIETDARMRTSSPEVFAAGDVTGGPGFVYVAALQGSVAARAALADLTGEEAPEIDMAGTPRITFTDPQVAAVGMTEEEARTAGLEPKVVSLPASYLPRALVSYRTAGAVKLVADAASDRVLGAHIVSANAGDAIGEAVLAVRLGLRVADLLDAPHAYLTWGEGLKLAAQTFDKDVAKLSCCA